MKVTDREKIHMNRKKRNEDVLKRMRDGESLKNYDNMNSWFPPREIIKKDLNAVAKLYNHETENLKSVSGLALVAKGQEKMDNTEREE